jgi:hypothetical protein
MGIRRLGASAAHIANGSDDVFSITMCRFTVECTTAVTTISNAILSVGIPWLSPSIATFETRSFGKQQYNGHRIHRILQHSSRSHGSAAPSTTSQLCVVHLAIMQLVGHGLLSKTGFSTNFPPLVKCWSECFAPTFDQWRAIALGLPLGISWQ